MQAGKAWVRAEKITEKRNMVQKGSITIYLLLTLMLILAVIFTMLESLRAEQLNLMAKENAQQIMESVFSQYDREIFERYQLFFYEIPWEDEADFSAVYSMAEKVASAAFAPHTFAGTRNAFLYRVRLSDTKTENYELATDRKGQAFIKQAAACAKEKAPTEALEKAVGWLEEAGRQEEEAGSFSEIENGAFDAMKKTEKPPQGQKTQGQKTAGNGTVSGDKAAAGANPAGTAVTNPAGTANPLESMKKIKKTGIISLVVNPQKEISAASLEKETMLTKRTLHTGTAEKENINIADKIWMLHYVDQYFSDFTGTAGTALSYEKEYIAAGKSKDSDNLKAVVNRLLLLREACNYASIKQDVKKCELALTIAASICGVTGTSVLTAAVQQGILLAWAYGESILDVRTLLEGGKISFFKTTGEWTLELEQLAQVKDSWLTAKECETGMAYGSYLDLFLLLQSPETTAMRCLTLIEKNIQALEGKEHLQMDRMVTSMECTFTYEAKPLFLKLVPQLKDRISGYFMVKKESYGYGTK